MSLKDAYIRIADRSLQAGKALRTSALHESAMFHAYHAFESIGAAFAAHFNIDVRNRSHSAKLKEFSRLAKRTPIARQVAVVALIVKAVRNTCLYPVERTAGTCESPDQIISAAGAKDALKRVGGVVKAAKNHM